MLPSPPFISFWSLLYFILLTTNAHTHTQHTEHAPPALFIIYARSTLGCPSGAPEMPPYICVSVCVGVCAYMGACVRGHSFGHRMGLGPQREQGPGLRQRVTIRGHGWHLNCALIVIYCCCCCCCCWVKPNPNLHALFHKCNPLRLGLGVCFFYGIANGNGIGSGSGWKYAKWTERILILKLFRQRC